MDVVGGLERAIYSILYLLVWNQLPQPELYFYVLYDDGRVSGSRGRGILVNDLGNHISPYYRWRWDWYYRERFLNSKKCEGGNRFTTIGPGEKVDYRKTGITYLALSPVPIGKGKCIKHLQKSS